VSAVVASLIAVAGTLLGSSSTYWFQQKVAQQAEATARGERLRQDRLAACSEFAAAVTDLRNAMIAVWFREGRKDRTVADKDRVATDDRMTYAEVDRLGAVALGAKFRMLLVLDDPGLRELADDVFRRIDAIQYAADKAELETLRAKFEAHISAFVATAAKLLGVGQY
jgi:hypothetical protein